MDNNLTEIELGAGASLTAATVLGSGALATVESAVAGYETAALGVAAGKAALGFLVGMGPIGWVAAGAIGVGFLAHGISEL